MDHITLTLGRLHPLVIHFPIALVLLGAGIELSRWRWPQSQVSRMVPHLLLFAGLGAGMAILSGWFFAREYFPPPSRIHILSWHKWLGFASGITTLIAAGVSYRLATAESRPGRMLRSLVILLAAVLTAITGHWGSVMVWGADFFSLAPT